MKRFHFVALLMATLVVGCDSKREKIVSTFDGVGLGTTYHIVVRADSSVNLRAEIDSVFAASNASMSIFDETSILSQINNNQIDTADRYIIECLTTAAMVSDQCGGAYDVTIKPITSAYGFTGGDTVKNPNIDSLMQFVGYKKIRIEGNKIIKENPNMQIDLNSVAKGLIVDLMARMIESKGIEDYLVEIGGEIFCKGKNAKNATWVVGIDTPEEGNFSPGESLQVALEISNRGMATSGNYRRFYIDADGRKIVHTVDARTGLPAIHSLLSATVIAETCALADSYGTMLMVLGIDESKAFLAAHPEIDAYFIYSDDTEAYKAFATKGITQIDYE